MPLYEYECKQCKTIKTELHNSDVTTSPTPCYECLAPMIRIMSVSNGQVINGTPKFHKQNKTKSIKSIK